MASGVLYVVLVGLTAWLPGMRSTLGMGVAASALTLLGYFVSPTGGELWKAVANRLLAMFAIWVTAALVWHHKRLNARRDEAEARAARSEEQLRATIEASPAGMLLVDRQGRIALVNLEAARLFGYERHQLLGQPIETLVPQLDRQAHANQRAAFVAEARSQRMGDGREIAGVDKHGRKVLLEIGLTRIDTSAGEFVLATLTNVRDRRRFENARARRLVSRRLIDAEEAQRKRIAREIHDALGQALTALKLDIGWLAAHLPAAEDRLHARAVKMEELTAHTIDEVRRLSAELRPVILDDQGLPAAIRWQVSDFEKRTGLYCALALPDAELSWSNERCSAAFRVLQESLTNVARHAGARKVSVALWTEANGDGVLEVRDDGCGISVEQAAGTESLGLLGMRERALLQGGTLTVTGVAGDGTTVLLRMPCELDESHSDVRSSSRRAATAPFSSTKEKA